MRRYNRTPIIGGGTQYGTSYLIPIIHKAIASGEIQCEEIVLQDNERLDTLAGKYYGDSKLAWVLATASGIGNIGQTPPGTIIKIPDLDDLSKYV